MDRRTRPDFARRRIACALALALCTAGCGGDYYYRVSGSSGGPLTPGVSTRTGFYAYSGSTSTSYTVLGMMAALIIDNERWSESLMRYGAVPVPTPPLDQSRKVNLQDCTKPIEDWSANLQCR